MDRPIFLAITLLAATSALGQTPGVVAAPQSKTESQVRTPYHRDTVVASIDGRRITLDELLFRFGSLPDEVRDGYGRSERGLAGFLSDVVSNELIVIEAEKARLDKDPMFARLLGLRREDVLRDLYARTTLLTGLDDTLLHAMYDEQPSRFRIAPLARVRHILVTPGKETPPPNDSGDDAVGDEAARAKAERLRALVAGGEDFANVARRFSEDVKARSGGDLGWISPATLVPELEKVVLALPAGGVSEVVKSAQGYHLVEVLARRDGGQVPFESVRELLLQEAIAQRRAALQAAARESRDRLAKQHRVELHVERLPW